MQNIWFLAGRDQHDRLPRNPQKPKWQLRTEIHRSKIYSLKKIEKIFGANSQQLVIFYLKRSSRYLHHAMLPPIANFNRRSEDMYTKSEIMKAATMFYCPFSKDLHFGTNSLCLDCNRKYRNEEMQKANKMKGKGFWTKLKQKIRREPKYNLISEKPILEKRNSISREVAGERCQFGPRQFSDHNLYNMFIANSLSMYF